MKKPSKRGATAASIIVGLTASSALLLSNCNFNGTVYGPPPTSDTDDTSYQTVESTEPETSIDPSQNENEDVYGPPDSFDPEDNIVPAVYGPPEA